MTASYREIQAQIRELTAAAESARKAELEQALSTIRELVQQYELTSDDLLGLFKKRRGRPAGRTASQSTKGVPKYRDPDTGRTWTGQGKPPNWIRDAADRSVFLIEGAEGVPWKKSSRGAGRRGAATKTKRVGRKRAAG
jgi:DNA-binding protein H-NS